ncbi:DUF4340 domain-containing protein [bacterium]|nr:DUF4340 domain-containing protein [bacterium]
MKTRPLFILGAILVVLIALKFWQRSDHEAQLAESGLETVFPAMATGQIGRLVIDGPGEGQIELTRSGDQWRVDSSYGHPAAADKVDRLLGELVGLKGEFRSDKAAVLADYKLDDASAVQLTAYDLSGAELGHLLLGDRLKGAAGFFVRKAGEDRTYAASGNLLGDLGIYGDTRDPAARSFVDLKAVVLDRAQVDKLTLVEGATELELVKVFDAPPADTVAVDRSKYSWTLGKTTLDKAKADAVLGALVNIYARDLLDPAVDYGFGGARRAQVTLADGSQTTIEFGESVTEPEAGVAMRVGGDSSVYLVYDKLPDRIFKAKADLLPDKG